MANDETTPLNCKEAGVNEQTFYRWRKEFGGLKLDVAKRLKELARMRDEFLNGEIFYSLEEVALRAGRRASTTTPNGDSPRWAIGAN